VITIIQLAIASVAFFTGSFAFLETLPTPPLFEIQFISNTRPILAEIGVTLGVVGLLLIPLAVRAPGRWQWVFIASIVLAAAGFAGGLFVVWMTG